MTTATATETEKAERAQEAHRLYGEVKALKDECNALLQENKALTRRMDTVANLCQVLAQLFAAVGEIARND